MHLHLNLQTQRQQRAIKEISLKSSRNQFARLLVLAKSRGVDHREVLSYSPGSYPIATVDENLTKTAKTTYVSRNDHDALYFLANVQFW